MKTVYLVDVENVGSVWLKLLSDMKGNDKIYLFTSSCSDCSCDLSFKMSDLEQIKKAFSRMTVISVLNGTSHSLDFQLVSFFGVSSSDGQTVRVRNFVQRQRVRPDL